MAENADLPKACDVAIVGAGPAGLAAATTLKARGVSSVIVLDREPEPGGIPRHCGHYPFGVREFGRLLKGPAYARRLVADARAAGVSVRAATTVLRIDPGPMLVLSTADGQTTLTAKRVILATGVRETSRAARMISGRRPLGVLPTGALQAMIYLHNARPFSRPVIVGTELVSFSAILTCRHAGIRPVAMIEENARITARAFAAGLPRMLGIPLLLSARLTEILGRHRVEAVRVTDAGGKDRVIETDGVIVTGKFTPEATLARQSGLDIDPATGGPVVNQYGQCSDPAVFAAGNLLRPVETAGWSWREGVAMANLVQRSLMNGLPVGNATARLQTHGPALRYVMPQRLSLPFTDTGMDMAQLRLNAPAHGWLTARSDGETVWSGRIDSLPERRILMPLKPLAGIAPDSGVTITVEGG